MGWEASGNMHVKPDFLGVSLVPLTQATGYKNA